jgi:predicted negative regulator of RcsB-dependent stress response
MVDNISRERKKELESPDPFQKNLLQALSFAKTYKKQVIIAISLIVITILVFSGIMISFKKAEDTAAQLLAKAVTKYDSTITNDPAKAFMEAESAFSFLLQKYTNTNAGKLGKIQFAKICYDASKFEESYKYYKEALNEFDNYPVFKNFLLISMGNACIAMGKSDEAKKYFLKIESNKSDMLKADALFYMAMLNEKAGNTAESKKMYGTIVKEHEKSIYRSIAEEKIAVIN